MSQAKRVGIILACDISNADLVAPALEPVMPFVDLVKIGLEAMTAEDMLGHTTATCTRELVTKKFKKGVMWDMKLNDISNTVAAAAKNIVSLGSEMFTLHATVSDKALQLAAAAGRNISLPLAVTVLTDLDDEQCFSRFERDPETAVLDFARNAAAQGIRGVVCSPKELKVLQKDPVTAKLIKVIPGIRPAWASANDQQRIMTPAEAAAAGADYIVIGRPILQPPKGMLPAEAAKLIRDELDGAYKPGAIVDVVA